MTMRVHDICAGGCAVLLSDRSTVHIGCDAAFVVKNHSATRAVHVSIRDGHYTWHSIFFPTRLP
jgi:hypothetical protein